MSATELLLVVPIAERDFAYGALRHADCQLSDRQAAILRLVLTGLYETNSRLANGRPVVTTADAIRWIMEQLATARDEQVRAAAEASKAVKKKPSRTAATRKARKAETNKKRRKGR